MMRAPIFILLFLVVAQNARAQFLTDYASGYGSINFGAGFFQADLSPLRDHFNKTYGRTFINDRMQALSVFSSGSAVLSGRNGYAVFDGHLRFSRFQPQEISISDSLQFSFGGWELGLGYFGKDVFFFSDIFDLQISPGYSFGRLKLHQRGEAGKRSYGNKISAPKICAEARLRFGEFTFGLRGEYLHDLSRIRWVPEHADLPALPGTRARGWMLQGFIGLSGARKSF